LEDSVEQSNSLIDIEKDINRSFPYHPYFNVAEFGNIGQKALRNVLAAYSVQNPVVGYCQSMNFMVGFLLMVSGSREKETFWVFNAFVAEHKVDPPFMDGLTGFY
jgi:hypothetical protein